MFKEKKLKEIINSSLPTVIKPEAEDGQEKSSGPITLEPLN